MEGSQAEPRSAPWSLMLRWWRENSLLPAPGDEAAHSPQAPAAALWACLFVQEKTGAGREQKALLGRLLLQHTDGKRLHELPSEMEHPLLPGWSKEKPSQACFPLASKLSATSPGAGLQPQGAGEGRQPLGAALLAYSTPALPPAGTRSLRSASLIS